MKSVFLKLIPQNIKKQWFSDGLTPQLQTLAIKAKDIQRETNQIKCLDKLSKIQLLIIWIFKDRWLAHTEVLAWMNAIELYYADCIALIPFLPNPAFLTELQRQDPILLNHLMDLVRTCPNDYLHYLLEQQQPDIILFLIDRDKKFIKDWINNNHQKMIQYCFCAEDSIWYGILFPLLNEKVMQAYLLANEHLIYEKMNSSLFSLLIQRIKNYFPQLMLELIYSKKFAFFYALIEHNQFNVFQELFDFLENDFKLRNPRIPLPKLFIHSQNLRPLNLAAKHGNLEFILWFNKHLDGNLPQILASTGFLAAKIAIAHLQYEVFDYLCHFHAPEFIMNNSTRYDNFEDQDFDGDFLNIALQYNAFEYLEDVYQKKLEFFPVEDIFFNHPFHLLNSAALSGQIRNLEWIIHRAEQISPNSKIMDELLINAEFEPFILAGGSGHIGVLNWLMENITEELKDEVFVAFITFYKKPYQIDKKYSLNLLEWLQHHFQEKFIELMMANDYAGFKYAIGVEHPDVLAWILSLSGLSLENLPKKVQAEIIEMALHIGAFVFLDDMLLELSKKKFNRLLGLLDMEHLSQTLSPDSQAWIHNNTNYTCSNQPVHETPSLNLEKPTLEDIMSLTIHELKKVAKKQNYLLFFSCVKYGELNVLKYLFERLSQKYLEFFIQHDFKLIQTALHAQQFAIFEFLIEQLHKMDDKISLPILSWLDGFFANENLSALIWILQTGLLDLVSLDPKDLTILFEFLLNARSTLVMDFIFPQIKDNLLLILRENISLLNRLVGSEFYSILDELFKDISLFEAYESYVYCPENRSEQNISLLVHFSQKYFSELLVNHQTQDNLRLLYHLVRYSLKHTRHDQWVKKTLQLPAFRALAAQYDNQLLKLTMQNQDNEMMALLLAIPEVKALAQAHEFYPDAQPIDTGEESAMRSLTCFDQENISSVIKHYRPCLETLSDVLILNRIKLRLQKEYFKNPAVIQVMSSTIPLPLSWDKFQQLELGEDQNQALKAYYAHPIHTALRFLSMPNAWIHPNMNPALLEVNAQGQKGAATREFRSLIAILYLAVTDKHMKPTDGHTLESRWQHFYLQLAMAGRAHNCEKKEIVLRTDGTQIQREVDDMEPDKPTCANGILRHLFQSVLGHPLFSGLNQDLVKQELHSFVYHYYQNNLDCDMANILQGAFDQYIEDLDMSAFQVLKSYDIPQDIQTDFILEMKERYAAKFTSSLEKFVLGKLSVDETDAHVIRFHQNSVQQVLNSLIYKRKGEEDSGNGKRHCSKP